MSDPLIIKIAGHKGRRREVHVTHKDLPALRFEISKTGVVDKHPWQAFHMDGIQADRSAEPTVWACRSFKAYPDFRSALRHVSNILKDLAESNSQPTD